MGTLRLVTTATTANPNVHDLYLDDSGQLEWIGGDITDQDSYALMVAQRIKCRLLFSRGDWYQDQRLGTPWKERIWKKGVTAETVKSVIRPVIEGTPGVRALTDLSVSMDAEAREATVEWTVTTETNLKISSADLDAPFVIEVPDVR